jgi:hypothetical protein
VAEWRRNLDLKAWGAEMRALERKLRAEQDEKDVRHLKTVLFWSNVCYFTGLALAGFCNPMQVRAHAPWVPSLASVGESIGLALPHAATQAFPSPT